MDDYPSHWNGSASFTVGSVTILEMMSSLTPYFRLTSFIGGPDDRDDSTLVFLIWKPRPTVLT